MSNAKRQVVTATVAGAVGLLIWITTMARAPRYSHAPHENMGHGGALIVTLIAAAACGGFARRQDAKLIGLMLGLPGFVLSPWTAPRGDNDGLWLSIVPVMGVLTVVLVVVASLGATVRRRTSRVVDTPTQLPIRG